MLFCCKTILLALQFLSKCFGVQKKYKFQVAAEYWMFSKNLLIFLDLIWSIIQLMECFTEFIGCFIEFFWVFQIVYQLWACQWFSGLEVGGWNVGGWRWEFIGDFLPEHLRKCPIRSPQLLSICLNSIHLQPIAQLKRKVCSNFMSSKHEVQLNLLSGIPRQFSAWFPRDVAAPRSQTPSGPDFTPKFSHRNPVYLSPQKS